jgi:hypothetical protein
MSCSQATLRAQALAELGHLATPGERREWIESACIDTGGTLIPPGAGGSMGSALAELDLLGVSARSEAGAHDSEADAGDAAIRAWMQAARRTLEDAA